MKQLITDQLIEEYQKKMNDLSNIDNQTLGLISDNLLVEARLINQFISSLQSKRQQEVQNVIDVYKDGDVLKHLYSDGNDYFTQTFEQKGGGNGQ